MSIKTETPITAERVPEEKRLDFLPSLFGRHYMRGEMLVYSYMEKLCNAYNGGYWEFYQLNNGGGFLVPSMTGPLQICWPDNCFEAEMSTEAAGITASLFALNRIANESGEDARIEQYYTLLDFALEHPEGSRIRAAID